VLSATEYITEAEEYKWSFVLEYGSTQETIKECDANMGRVKESKHWMAVQGAYWRYPLGPSDK
jgi:hypothetical protein